jgi:predicted nuclease of predicted toxin-antitoxin system
MRFLVDECTGPSVAQWLSDNGHDVFSVYEDARGISDDHIIQMAFSGDWILVTNDKDFGEKVFREQQPHKGIILLRLEDERTSKKISLLQKLIESYSGRLPDSFVVVTEDRVRFG